MKVLVNMDLHFSITRMLRSLDIEKQLKGIRVQLNDEKYMGDIRRAKGQTTQVLNRMNKLREWETINEEVNDYYYNIYTNLMTNLNKIQEKQKFDLFEILER